MKIATRARVAVLAVAAVLVAGLGVSPSAAAPGDALTWGHNFNGQLGNGTDTDSNVPVMVSNLTNVVAVDGGGFHSLALRADGTVRAWGQNFNGQLGNGTDTDSNVPVMVSNLTNVDVIAGGGGHSLAADAVPLTPPVSPARGCTNSGLSLLQICGLAAPINILNLGANHQTATSTGSSCSATNSGTALIQTCGIALPLNVLNLGSNTQHAATP